MSVSRVDRLSLGSLIRKDREKGGYICTAQARLCWIDLD